jgi:hypothetical protein
LPKRGAACLGKQIKEAIRKQVGEIGKPAVEDLSIFDNENTGRETSLWEVC